MSGQGDFGDAELQIHAHEAAGGVEFGVQFREQRAGSGQDVGRVVPLGGVGVQTAAELPHDDRTVGIVALHVSHDEADLPA